MIHALYDTYPVSSIPKLSTDVHNSTWIVHAEKLRHQKWFLLYKARSYDGHFVELEQFSTLSDLCMIT